MTQVQETQVQAAFVTLITHLDLKSSKKVYSGVLSDDYIPQEKSNEKFQVIYSESLKAIKTQVGCSHITALQSQPFSAQQVLCRRIFSPIARIFSCNGQLFVLNDDEIHCGLFHSDRLHSLQDSKLTAMEHRLTTYKANMIADVIFNKNNNLNNPEIKILIDEAKKEVPELESLPSQVTKIPVPDTSDFHMLVNFTPFPFFLHSTQMSSGGILTSFFYCFDAINEFSNYNGGEYNIVYCNKQNQVILLNYDTKSKKIQRIILSNEITGGASGGTCKNFIFFDITDCDTEVTSLTLKQTGTNKTITPKIVKIGPHRWRCFYEQEFDINALFKKDAPSRSSLSFEATINEKIQMPLGSLMTDGNFSFTTHSAKAVTAQTLTLNDAARSQEDAIPEWMKVD